MSNLCTQGAPGCGWQLLKHSNIFPDLFLARCDRRTRGGERDVVAGVGPSHDYMVDAEWDFRR